jgi:phage virion morphogenesis protein
MSENVIEGQKAFNETMTALINSIKDGGQRRRLLFRLARRALQLNKKRIGAQLTPEGMTFVPRKPRTDKKGRMFSKIKNPTWLKAVSDNDSAHVHFVGIAGRVAATHHFGLRAKVDNKSKRLIKYEARPLLGVSGKDADILEDALYQHFAHIVK